MAHPGRLGQLGRAQRRLEHRLDHHVAGVARLGGAALASISSVRIAWSSEPQLTPMRTGLSLSMATLMIVAKCSSWRLAPTLPGLIRYLASERGRLRVLGQELVPVVVEVADDRDVDAQAADLADHLGDGRGGSLGVDRDAHELRAGVGQRGRPGWRWRRRRRCPCWSSTGRRPGGPSRRGRRPRRR